MLALITGASAGLGLELARCFAADGHDLVLVARRRERLEELARELEASRSIRVAVLPADLAQPRAAFEIVEALSAQGLGPIDALVNNAGFGTLGAFAELELERELEQIQVNIGALVALTRLLLPQMIERGRGRILNLGSTAGFQPGPYMATYFATKAFVNHFTEALAVELEGSGVTATVSCPGATATEFGEVAGNGRTRLFQMARPASAREVAREAYDAMMDGEPMVVHGVRNKASVQLLRVSPRRLVGRLVARLNRAPGE